MFDERGERLKERKVQDPILVGALEYCVFSYLFRMIIELYSMNTWFYFQNIFTLN